MSLYDREALEDLARGWVSAATGIPLARCYWSGDAGARPEGLALSASLSLSPRAGRGGFALVTYQPRPLTYPAKGYSISGGALQVASHGLVSGDGPLELTGAVAGSYWVVSLGPSSLALAADFFAARAGAPLIALPGAGSGSIAAGASTVAYSAPAERARDHVVTLELRVEVRGGSPTGSGSPTFALETLREAVDASCPLAIVDVGAVQGLTGGVTGNIRLEPYALWACEIEYPTHASEAVAVIERIADPTTTVL